MERRVPIRRVVDATRSPQGRGGVPRFPIIDRSAALTAVDVGNAEATSGSRTTATTPFVMRAAKRFRRDFA